MALIACKECAHQVSDQAPNCPSCGAPLRKAVPHKQGTSGCAWLALIFIAIPFVGGMLGLFGRSDDTPAAPALTDAQCKQSLQCWGDRHSGAATGPCKRAVEAQAKWQWEWTDGALETKFPRFAWVDPSVGTLQYIGDKVKFQNGFGAWQHMEYRCVFDPSSRTATAVVTGR